MQTYHNKFSNKNIIDYFVEACQYDDYSMAGSNWYDLEAIIDLISNL